MKIENQIAQAVTAALKALYGIEAAPETLGIQKTKKEFEKYSYACGIPVPQSIT